MRTLLLTGYPGWLGNRLLESLLADPLPGLETVRCLVLKSPASPALPDSKVQVEFVEADLMDSASLERACTGCDTIIHAAGILHPRRTKDWYDVNTEGTKKLLAAAQAGGGERFVFVSSNAAAGSAASFDQLLTEAMPAKPRSHYGRSKWLAEEIVNKAAIDSVILRPCMFYGPPVPPRHTDIYQRIKTGKMPMVGDGNYRRSVTHIESLIQACRLAATTPGIAGETFYIADAEPATTREIVEAMATALEAKPRYLYLPALIAKVAHLTDNILASVGIYWRDMHLLGEADWHVGVSIEKARKLMNYQPEKSLNEGMAEAIAWCREEGLIE